MNGDSHPPNDELRREALARYAELKPHEDPAIAELADLAARICETPMAAISLLAEDRQHFIARVGMDIDELPLSETFCNVTLGSVELVVVEDAREDDRFRENQLLTEELGIRFYAGHSLFTPDGIAIGTICVVDREPRKPTEVQCAALKLLAHQAVTHLELRRNLLNLEKENEEHRKTESSLRLAEQKFRDIFEHSTDGIFQSTLEGKFISANSMLARIYGFETPDELIHHFNDIGAQLYVEPGRREEFIRQLKEHDLLVGFESQVYNRNGEIIWIAENARVVRNGIDTVLYFEGTVENITARKRAEVAVRDSEERFRSIWEKSADGMRLTDADGVIRTVNSAYCKMVGIEAGELVGQPFIVSYHPDSDTKLWLDSYRNQFASRSIPEHADQTRVFHSGRTADLELSNSFVDFEGQDAVVLSVFHEVTERKRVQAALRESEILYHSLVENLPQNIFRKDADGHFTFVNKGFCNELGKSREEILGKTDFDFFPPALAEKYKRDDNKIMSGRKPYETVEAHYVPDKGKIYVQVIKNPLMDPDGNVMGIQGIFWDVTERKRIEEQLAFERDLLRALLDNVPDRIYFKDTESRFLQCSLAMAKRLGLNDPAEVVGKRDSDFHPAELAREYFEDEQRILMTGTPIINKVEKQATKDGEEIWASVTKVPTRNRAGFITGIIGISRDITELKKVEQELALTRDEALESTRLKSQFLAAMSHEIRTPMNGIIGMTELLLDTELPPAQKEFAETIASSANSLLHIINDILDFSKIEAGKMILEAAPFDLLETVENAIELLAYRAQAKNLDPVCWIDSSVWRHVCGDTVRLGQVLVNMIGNAIKFTDDGQIVVRVEQEAATDDSVTLKFSVTDTGIGIAPDAQQRIFEAFTQADGTSTRKYGGTGLGLAISQQLIQLMGGEMGLSSTLGAGSSFWFSVTLAKAAAPQGFAENSDDLRGVQILLAVENPLRRQALLQAVTSWGMRGAVADTAEMVISCLREAAKVSEPFDVALIDIKLKDTDGLSLAESITMDTALPETRLVLLTPLGQRMDADILKLAGFSGALLKPVRRDRLRECLSRILLRPEQGSPEFTTDTIFIKRPGGEVPMHRPLRVLLVEDNAVNQKVALLQLNKLGCTPELVTDGRQAVEAFKKSSYDLILMDCQMPIMDGYEATRRIRDCEASSGKKRIRIVAMTADASRDHAEGGQAAGMDDTITKPVHLPDLQAVLQMVQQQVAFSPTAKSESSTVEPTIDRTVLSNLRELQEPGEPDPVAELIDLYLADVPIRIEKMAHGISACDVDEARAAAHSIKGSSRNLGARPLATLSEQAEEYFKQGDWAGAAEQLDRIKEEFKLLSELLMEEKK